jgi:hypothetical protein
VYKVRTDPTCSHLRKFKRSEDLLGAAEDRNRRSYLSCASRGPLGQKKSLKIYSSSANGM